MHETVKRLAYELGELIKLIPSHSLEDQVYIQNETKRALHAVSPFKNEPVDCVLWVKNDQVKANDYNPNSVAPPEMQLLEVSIHNDGYTQPIVTWKTDDMNEVIDGFHRNRVGKESSVIRGRIHGYLPVVTVNEASTEKGNRIASTIRHNRARGKHAVSAMTDIVLELKKRNWSEARISKELGMDEDEILRLCQISGLAEAFENEDFSKAWESAIHSNDPVNYDFETTENDL
jgi:ParB-like chromosome segregation protein Spo0J